MKCENANEFCPAKILVGGNISKNGVYRIDASSASEIRVKSGISAHIFDATSGSRELHRRIILEEGSEVIICGYIYDAEYNVEILTEGEHTNQNIAYLLVSIEGTKVVSKISSKITKSSSQASIHIVSFVGNGGDIAIDGEMEVSAGVKQTKVHLREDNIFLGESGKIRSIPTLRIHTDDVVAGHAARVERIPEEKLYYLLSRGLDKKSATTLLIESMVGSLFHRLKNISETLYEDLKLDILTLLSHHNRKV